MIHVVYIIPTLNFGGAERLVADLVNNCDKTKFRFSVIVLFDQNSLEKEITGAPIYVVPKKGKLSFHLREDLREKLKELKPDIVHTHLFGADLWGRLAARDLSLPVVTTEHNLNYSYGLFRTLVRKLMKNYSQQYVACSQAVADYMSQTYGIGQDKIVVIKNGIVLKKFVIPEPTWQEPLRFAMIGRLTQQKGQGIVLSVLANLKHLPWQLDVIGQGENYKFLRQMCAQFGLDERVNFLSPENNVAKILSQAQVVLTPSLWEGLGVVAMEAMVAGRLIVASNTGGLKEIIQDKKTGLLIEPGNVGEWTKALSAIINNPEMCKPIALAGQNFARDNFGLEKTIEQYQKVYQIFAPASSMLKREKTV